MAPRAPSRIDTARRRCSATAHRWSPSQRCQWVHRSATYAARASKLDRHDAGARLGLLGEAASAMPLFAGHDPSDRSLMALVGELATRSTEFRTWWGGHTVRTHSTGTKNIRHPVRHMTLGFEVLAVASTPGRTIVTYLTEPATPEWRNAGARVTAEVAARTLAFPDAQSVEGPTALLTSSPLTYCVGQVGHPLCRHRADRLQLCGPRPHPRTGGCRRRTARVRVQS